MTDKTVYSNSQNFQWNVMKPSSLMSPMVNLSTRSLAIHMRAFGEPIALRYSSWLSV